MRLILLPSCVALAGGCGTTAGPSNILECNAIPGVLACDGFETDDSRWNTLVDRGVIVLDDSDAADGAKSLHATVATGGGKAVRTRAVAVVDRYYARFFVNVPTTADTTGMSLVHFGETVAPFLGTNVEIADGMLGVGVQSADVYSYPTPMPLGRWVCVDVDLTVSDTAGHITVRADGAQVVDRDGLDTRPAGGMGDLEVGLSFVATEATAGTTVLLDNVVVADQPLAPCP